jgi:hypothetical protein
MKGFRDLWERPEWALARDCSGRSRDSEAKGKKCVALSTVVFESRSKLRELGPKI